MPTERTLSIQDVRMLADMLYNIASAKHVRGSRRMPPHVCYMELSRLLDIRKTDDELIALARLLNGLDTGEHHHFKLQGVPRETKPMVKTMNEWLSEVEGGHDEDIAGMRQASESEEGI